MREDCSKTILIVDDNDDARELLGLVLRADGYHVREAENGRDALDQLEAMTTLPCLLLLDIMMPVLDGRELLQILHQRTRFASLPVVVLSASGTESGLPLARMYMPKPTDLARLRRVVSDICGPC